MKRFQSRYVSWLMTLVLGLVVFLFWRFRYPFALTYQEQLQLFLFDDDFFLERMAEPGGFARYIAEFLVQFYNGVTIGAVIIAVLFMLLQRLTWRVMHSDGHYALSFIPVSILWFSMGDENVMLAYGVSLLLALVVMVGWDSVNRFNRYVRWGVVIVVVPILYWLIGPMVLMVAVWMQPLSVVYALAIMLLSAHYLPFPMQRVVLGISYYRVPITMPYLLMAIPVVILLLGYCVRRLPTQKPWLKWAEGVLLAALVVWPHEFGFDQRKYDLIEYDYLVRVRDWQAIIAKAEKKSPDLPMSVCANNLALAMTNQLGERVLDFYQRSSEGLLPKFERNFATTQLTGEVYFHLGLVNTAQRLAFEAMEAIPNYNKSPRVIKRLAETNLINGEYDVARKYLQILERTIFYRPWAKRTMAILGDEKAIDAHPLYGKMRQYRLQEDFLFSEQELDKICGQLFMHNQQNTMAMQYLVMAPLLDGDAQRFMAYVSYVQSKVNYNPRYVREAIAKIGRVK